MYVKIKEMKLKFTPSGFVNFQLTVDPEVALPWVSDWAKRNYPEKTELELAEGKSNCDFILSAPEVTFACNPYREFVPTFRDGYRLVTIYDDTILIENNDLGGELNPVYLALPWGKEFAKAIGDWVFFHHQNPDAPKTELKWDEAQMGKIAKKYAPVVSVMFSSPEVEKDANKHIKEHMKFPYDFAVNRSNGNRVVVNWSYDIPVVNDEPPSFYFYIQVYKDVEGKELDLRYRDTGVCLNGGVIWHKNSESYSIHT